LWRLGLAAIAAAAGLAAARLLVALRVSPDHVVAGLAIALAGSAGLGKRAAP